MDGSADKPIDRLVVRATATLPEMWAAQAAAAREAGLPAGISVVVDDDGVVVGTVTDGDVRRYVAAHGELPRDAGSVMTTDPILFHESTPYREILDRLPAELAVRGRRSRRFLGKIVLVDDHRRPTRVLDYHQLWEQRVATHRHVVVVGMGYVGLTLALVLADEGFLVTGVDVNEQTVASLARGESTVHEIGLPELLREHIGESLHVRGDVPEDGDVFVVTVGTPITEGREGPEPDLSHLREALEAVGARLRPGALVVLRSTVPLGTCRTVAVPILEAASGLRAGPDFHLAFAPERTSEGQALAELRSLPQIIGGINAESVDATAALFRELSPTIVRMESLEAAELAKLVNNAFRDVIFSFANHVVQLAAPWNFDVTEAIRAANHGYPRDPVPLPSPGVGGPCLTKDPYILASAQPGTTSLMDHGRAINESMHEFVANAVVEHLRRTGRDPRQATVLVCGLAFKGHPETGDLRGSSSTAIAQVLAPQVGRVLGHDPVVDKAAIAEVGLEPSELPPEAHGIDAVVICNNHLAYQRLDVFELVRGMADRPVVFDGWHVLRADEVLAAKPSIYAGLGFWRSSLDDVTP